MFKNGGIRNLGANGNQPLITNQNDFQIFDNVTRVAGQAHDEGRRQPHAALARDPERRHDRRPFDFNQNLTSNCAGISQRLHRRQRTPASTSPASCSATRATPDRTLFDAGHLHRDAARVRRSTSRTTSASTSRLTVNAGLRWDVYVPWVEEDDRQSNFDVSTGRFVVASDDATINGVEVGRYLQTYSKTRLRAAARLRLRPERRRPDASSAAATACSGTSRRAAPRRRRRRTSRSCSRTAMTTNFGATTSSCRTDWPPPPRRRSERAAGGQHAVGLRHRLPRRARAQLQRQRAAAVRHQLHGGGRLRRIARPARWC